MKASLFSIILVLVVSFKTYADALWMYGLHPADSQERYDDYMKQLYVVKPYTRQDYEDDLFYLYEKNQEIKKVSTFCMTKTKNGVDIQRAYQLWEAENKQYIVLIESLWNKIIRNSIGEKKQLLQQRLNKQIEEHMRALGDNSYVNNSCDKEYTLLEYAPGKPRKSEEEKFSAEYRNVDFFLHPEKKKKILDELKSQLVVALQKKRDCEQKRGVWKPGGLGGYMGCVFIYSDAGKACTDNSQCQGGCVDISRRAAEPKGVCKADSSKFGCYSYLTNGKSDGPRLCID